MIQHIWLRVSGTCVNTYKILTIVTNIWLVCNICYLLLLLTITFRDLGNLLKRGYGGVGLWRRIAMFWVLLKNEEDFHVEGRACAKGPETKDNMRPLWKHKYFGRNGARMESQDARGPKEARSHKAAMRTSKFTDVFYRGAYSMNI